MAMEGGVLWRCGRRRSSRVVPLRRMGVVGHIPGVTGLVRRTDAGPKVLAVLSATGVRVCRLCAGVDWKEGIRLARLCEFSLGMVLVYRELTSTQRICAEPRAVAFEVGGRV